MYLVSSLGQRTVNLVMQVHSPVTGLLQSNRRWTCVWPMYSHSLADSAACQTVTPPIQSTSVKAEFGCLPGKLNNPPGRNRRQHQSTYGLLASAPNRKFSFCWIQEFSYFALTRSWYGEEMPTEGRLKEKKALITAAGAGIGRATAEAFAREGCRVVATDLDVGKLEGLCGRIGAARRTFHRRGTGARGAYRTDSTSSSTAPDTCIMEPCWNAPRPSLSSPRTVRGGRPSPFRVRQKQVREDRGALMENKPGLASNRVRAGDNPKLQCRTGTPDLRDTSGSQTPRDLRGRDTVRRIYAA